MKTQFEPGDAVKYVPSHALGNLNHEDCEIGVVKRVSIFGVFVNYTRHGIEQQTAKLTPANTLIKFEKLIK